jgi:hypothetical protein
VYLDDILRWLPPKRSLVDEIHRRFIAFCFDASWLAQEREKLSVS